MRRSFLLVSNPTAGLAGRTLIPRVVACLQEAGATVTPFAATNGNRTPSAAIVREGKFDAIIASGGDGTVRELANALADDDVAGDDIPIGLIPTGTGNVLAEEVGLPRNPAALADILLKGPIATLRGSRVNGSAFYLMAGVGFDGTVVRNLDYKTKRRLGKAAYTLPVIKALAGKVPHIAVECNGTVHRASWVIVTNAQHYGGPFILDPQAHAGTESLTAFLIAPDGRWALLRALFAIARGDLRKTKGVTILPITSAQIRSDPPAPVQVDGDPFGTTPLTIQCGGPRLNLIVPESYQRVASSQEHPDGRTPTP